MRRVVPIALLACACGGGPEPVVSPPPLHVTAKPPAAPRARWVFSAPEQEIRAKLDLGDHKTLYVGEHGRRELEEGGKLENAPTLAEEALAGVLRDEKGRYVFVAEDGDTYTSAEPLGALERVRPPRAQPLASVTTGRAAILGIADGSLVRSTDDGATWTPVDYAGGKKPFGSAASVALDTKGNGVLVHLPQRLYVTHDDGATWTPLASPAQGAASALRDGADRVFVIGFHDARATLAGDKLVDTSDLPAPIFPGRPIFHARSFTFDDSDRPSLARHRSPFDMSAGLGHEEESRVLVGDHVVEIAYRGGKVEVRSAPLGESLGAPTTHPELEERILDETRVSAYGSEIAYLRAGAEDDDDSANPPASIVFRSKDYGATWTKEDVFPGVPIAHVRSIVLGPRGFTYVGPICPTRKSQCKPPKIRPAGKQAFEDVPVADDFDARTIAFDEAHDKVYVLANDVGGAVLYEGAISGSKLVRTNVIVPSPRTQWLEMTVDDQGTLRIFDHDEGQRVVMHERTVKGEELPARYIELRDTALAFAGRRGIAVSTHASYETNDAGDTWTRIPSNGQAHGVTCSAAGCLLEGAQRVGWDLPAVQSTEVVRAQATVPEKATKKPPVHAPVTPVKLACKVSGKGTTMEDDDVNWIDGAGAVRWARLSTDIEKQSVSVVWADKDAVHKVPLLGPQARGTMEVRTATDARDDGLVAARYQFARRSATGKLNPVSVELAWWSPASTRVRHGTIPAVKPFRVGRMIFSGRARVVDGGILFRGSPDDVLHFLHDDGKDETLGAPGISFDSAWHSGKRWVLVEGDDAVIGMAISDDGGKTWSRRGWGFGDAPSVSDASLETMNGKLVTRVHDGVYDVAWPVPGDPPAPVVVDSSSKDARCDALAVGSNTSREHVEGDSPVVMDLGGTPYTVADRVFHDSSTGKLCTSAYVMEQGRSNEAYLYPDKNGGWSGWSYRDDKTTVEPFTCK